MLADPTNLTLAATAVTPTGGAAVVFSKQIPGQYIAGTNDEPMALAIKSKFNPSGVTTFNTQLNQNKNLPPISGIPQSDDVLYTSVMVKVPNQSFTTAQVRSLLIAHFAWLVNGDNLDRILSGQL
jgi:hypothetical protein